MRLTDEQKAIIEANTPALKINAVAGSGKTTTLLEYAAKRRDHRILYLAYNRAVANEVRRQVEARSLTHVSVSTVHALAYRYTQGNQYRLVHELNEWEILDRYTPAQRHHNKDAVLLGWLIKDLVNYYLNSGHTQLDDGFLEHYRTETVPKSELQTLLDARSAELVGTVRDLLSDMKNKAIPAVHDFYLKLFQFFNKALPYDIVLVDEAQDTSGVMLAIVNRQPADKVFVGDTFQQIYAFRYAVNSLECIAAPSYWLSRSFRFGDGLARLIGEKVNDAYTMLGQEASIQIHGTSARTLFGKQAPTDPRPLAVIARSNLGLFDACLKWLAHGKARFYFEGGYSSYSFMNGRVLSVYYLSQGKRAKITDPLVARFQGFLEFKAFAEQTQNTALLMVIDLVARYGAQLFDFDRSIKRRLTDKGAADVIFTTTHKAKGQEYTHVEMLQEDFLTRADLRKALKNSSDAMPPAKLREEVNIYYVAATRAKQSIRLASF